MTARFVVDTHDFGDGLTDAECTAIAKAEAEAIRRRFPGVDVVVGSGRDLHESVDRFSGTWEEISAYSDSVWAKIDESWPFNGGPPVEDIVDVWNREGVTP